MTPSRQRARHAGRLPVRHTAREALTGISAASSPAITRGRDPPDRDPLASTKARRRLVHEREGLEVFDMRYIDEIGMKRHHGGGARRRWTPTPTCT
jgi:hypothetical protein